MRHLIEGVCKEYNVKVEVLPCRLISGYLANITVDYDHTFTAWGKTKESALNALEEQLIEAEECY